MKCLFFAGILLFGYHISLAQEEKTTIDEPQSSWNHTGNFDIMVSQTAFNTRWTGGGTSNLSANSSLVFKLNYDDDKISWNNRFLGDFGIARNKGEDFTRKTNDRLEINSIFGWKIPETSWSYSFLVNFKSQFAKGFEYSTNEEGLVVRTERTRFMSPGYLQFGPGFLWKHSDRLFINIAPATFHLVFVDRRFTSDPEYVDGDYFGMDANQSVRYDYGASISAYAGFDIINGVTMENILNLYSDYKDEPKNVDIDYTLNLKFKVNSAISANFVFQAIYDDNVVEGFQIREVFGVGVSFGV